MQTLLDAIIKTASSWRNHFTSPLKSTQFIAVTMTEFVFLEKDSLHIAVQLVHSPHLLCGLVQQQPIWCGMQCEDLFQSSTLLTTVRTVVSRHLSLPNPMKSCLAWNDKGCVVARIVAEMPMNHHQKMSAQTFMQNDSNKMGRCSAVLQPLKQLSVESNCRAGWVCLAPGVQPHKFQQSYVSKPAH